MDAVPLGSCDDEAQCDVTMVTARYCHVSEQAPNARRTDRDFPNLTPIGTPSQKAVGYISALAVVLLRSLHLVPCQEKSLFVYPTIKPTFGTLMVFCLVPLDQKFRPDLRPAN